MLVIAQRWTDRAGAEQLACLVVEALVLKKADTPSNAWRLFSAFYLPPAPIDLAFKWWDRGSAGMLPHMLTHVESALAGWDDADNTVSELKSWLSAYETRHTAMQHLLEDIARSLE